MPGNQLTHRLLPLFLFGIAVSEGYSPASDNSLPVVFSPTAQIVTVPRIVDRTPPDSVESVRRHAAHNNQRVDILRRLRDVPLSVLLPLRIQFEGGTRKLQHRNSVSFHLAWNYFK